MEVQKWPQNFKFISTFVYQYETAIENVEWRENLVKIKDEYRGIQHIAFDPLNNRAK